MAGTSVMKFRSFLLFACMAVVPLVAMFSHKVPREWRLAVQRFARGTPPAAKPLRQPEPSATAPEVAASPPAVAPGPETVPRPAPLVPVAPLAETALAASPQPASQPAPREPVGTGDGVRDRVAIEDQLRSLGAVSIECVPMMQGTSYRCSCRVPADPSGQLQRVFQSSNPDPVVALRNLHGQVHFWKHRMATRPDADNPLRTLGDGGQPGLR